VNARKTVCARTAYWDGEWRPPRRPACAVRGVVPLAADAHEPTAKGVDALALGGKCLISCHALLHRKGVRRIELAVQIGMDRQRGFFVNYRAVHESLLPMVLITWFRARARRDITVPIGTPVTWAISR